MRPLHIYCIVYFWLKDIGSVHPESVLRIRRGNRDDFPYFSIKHTNVTLHYNRLPEGFNEGPEDMFSLKK